MFISLLRFLLPFSCWPQCRTTERQFMYCRSRVKRRSEYWYCPGAGSLARVSVSLGPLASSGQIVSFLKSLPALRMLAKGIPEEESHENGSADEVAEGGRH